MFRERGILLDLYEDEKIVTVIRRHWLSFLNTIIIVAILIIVFFVGSVLVYGGMKDVGVGINSSELAPLVTDNMAKGAYLVFGPIYLLGVLGFFYIAWLDYYLDVFVLTNKRILHFEQLVLFGQKVSETSYQHIQDVSSQVKGFVHTILNIGVIFIETAGENENFSFSPIKDPGGLAAEILELQKKMWDADKARSDLDEDKIIQKMEEIHQEESQLSNEIKKQENKEAIKQEEKEIINQENNELRKQEIIKEIQNIVCDFPVAPVIERKEAVEIETEVYKDGRRVTNDGVIWQAEQELTSDILDVLNQMEG